MAIAGSAAVIVTVALTYLTVELPRWLASLVAGWVEIPGYQRSIEPEDVQHYSTMGRLSWDAVGRFIELNHLQLIGWGCLALAAVAIVGGIVLGRHRLAAAGAVALFLPVFGSFAGSMVFLVGIGILRVLWLPAWGTGILSLGDISYVPYMAVVWPAWQMGLDVRHLIAYLAIGAGLLAFILATWAWMLARFERRELVEGGIYRFSRHPQYLGWIIWSWGMTLLSALQPMPYGGFNPGGALAWTIATLVIVAVAWSEDERMLASAPAGYAAFRSRTPFLLPLPRAVARACTAPLRLVFPDGWPHHGRQILLAVMIYLALMAALSLPFAILDWPPYEWWAWPGYAWPV